MALFEDQPSRPGPMKMLWNICLPPKVSFFAWEAWWRKVFTLMHLKKRGFHMASKCPWCGKADEELNHCPSVWSLWEDLISITGLPWACPFLLKHLFLSWSMLPSRKRIRKIWRSLLCLIWAIWKERNHIVFDNVTFSFNRLKSSFVSMLTSWVGFIEVEENSLVRILLYIL